MCKLPCPAASGGALDAEVRSAPLCRKRFTDWGLPIPRRDHTDTTTTAPTTIPIGKAFAGAYTVAQK